MGRLNLTGQKFERLTAVEWNKEKHQWLCKCDCGAETWASSNQLTKGRKKSCGCLNIEKTRERAIKRNKEMAKYCDYEIQEDYVIMYTPKGDMFLIDLEDLPKLKEVSCCIDKYGYVICSKNGRRQKLHRFLTDAPKNMKVDHKNHDKTDNRKSNLRFVTNQQNQMNRMASKNNISGKAGVTYYRPNGKWKAQIAVNNKNINLGTFETKEDAIRVRIEAENKYFGEFSFTNSMNNIF